MQEDAPRRFSLSARLIDVGKEIFRRSNRALSRCIVSGNMFLPVQVGWILLVVQVTADVKNAH